METSPEDFKNIAQGVQAILISIAAIIGSAWAIVRFRYTREKEKASYEIEKIKRDIQYSRGIHIDLSCDFYKSDNGYELIVELELKNLGPIVKVYFTEDYPLRLNKIKLNDKNEVEYKEVARTQLITISADGRKLGQFFTSVSLFPNTYNRFNRAFKIKDPGLYALSIVLISPEEGLKGGFVSEADISEKEVTMAHLKKLKEALNFDTYPDGKNCNIIEKIIRIE